MLKDTQQQDLSTYLSAIKFYMHALSFSFNNLYTKERVYTSAGLVSIHYLCNILEFFRIHCVTLPVTLLLEVIVKKKSNFFPVIDMVQQIWDKIYVSLTFCVLLFSFRSERQRWIDSENSGLKVTFFDWTEEVKLTIGFIYLLIFVNSLRCWFTVLGHGILHRSCT